MDTSRRKSSNPNWPWWLEALVGYLRGSGRWVAGMVLLAAGFGGGAWLGWQVVREWVLFSEAYLVQKEHLVAVPQQPDWIASDVMAEVFRAATRDGPLYLWQERLSEQLADAFRQHPWVAKVHQVRKSYPTRIEVQLQWRRPVCMVWWQDRRLAVDEEGTLLPEMQLAPTDLQKYPHLFGAFVPPPRVPGLRWQDVHVLEGVQVAAALLPLWEKLHLAAIQAAPLPTGASAQTIYELLTQGGRRIIWGLGPSSQHSAEPTIPDKIARLQRYVQQYGSLDSPQGTQTLDLRLLPPVPEPHKP